MTAGPAVASSPRRVHSDRPRCARGHRCRQSCRRRGQPAGSCKDAADDLCAFGQLTRYGPWRVRRRRARDRAPKASSHWPGQSPRNDRIACRGLAPTFKATRPAHEGCQLASPVSLPVHRPCRKRREFGAFVVALGSPWVVQSRRRRVAHEYRQLVQWDAPDRAPVWRGEGRTPPGSPPATWIRIANITPARIEVQPRMAQSVKR